jgi:hypothetical protein
VLPPQQWRSRAESHRQRISAYTAPLRDLHSAGVRHPVHDFLFSYYSLTPGALERWHPGAGVVLAADPGASPADASGGWRFYRRVDPRPGLPAGGWTVDVGAFLDRRGSMVEFAHRILGATVQRPARLACFGLHEWAMVYRQTPEEVRHNAWPLRFPPDELARIVEALPVRCSHFDAFRFFTAPARPLNRLQPERATAPQFEQRGCLHANMDLYKWAFKLAPFTPAELIADCFALAREIREVDMRASPYDFAALGFAPIRIETPEGRAEYEAHQRDFASRSQPLRARLIAVFTRLLA